MVPLESTYEYDEDKKEFSLSTWHPTKEGVWEMIQQISNGKTIKYYTNGELIMEKDII